MYKNSSSFFNVVKELDPEILHKKDIKMDL